MGCGSSTPATSAASFPPPPDSGVGPITDFEITEFTSVISTKISGLFDKEMQSTTDSEGAFFQHVVAQAAKGNQLVAALLKVEAPPTPGLGDVISISAGQGATIEMKSTLHTIFRKAPGAVETMLVYAPLSVDASVGFGFNVKIAMNDGLTGTVMTYLKQGWSLGGMTLSGGQTSTKFTETKSTSLAEIVFQKVPTSAPQEVCFVQAGIHVSVSMGTSKTTEPDFASYLTQQGAEGWELAGCFMPPSAPPPVGVMSFEFDMPVIMAMQRVARPKPFKYCIAKYNYIIQIKMGKMSITGDVSYMVRYYAEKGWVVKSSLSLGAEMKPGKMSFAMPVILIFQSQEDLAEEPKANADVLDDQAQAATKIQSVYRGKQSATETAVIAAEKKQAATKLQANFRGNQVRKPGANQGASETGAEEEAGKGVATQAEAGAGELSGAQPEVAPFTGPSRAANPNGAGGFFFCCSGAGSPTDSIVEKPNPRP